MKYKQGTLGTTIRINRIVRHIGLRELAELVNISPAYLSRIETGREIAVSEGVLNSLAAQLDLSADELCALSGRVPLDVMTLLVDTPGAIAMVRQLLAPRSVKLDGCPRTIRCRREKGEMNCSTPGCENTNDGMYDKCRAHMGDEIPSGLDRLLGEMGVVDSLKAETEALRAEISALKAQLQHFETVAALETERVAVAVEAEREACAAIADPAASGFGAVPYRQERERLAALIRGRSRP